MASVISLFLDYKVGRRLSAQLSNQVGNSTGYEPGKLLVRTAVAASVVSFVNSLPQSTSYRSLSFLVVIVPRYRHAIHRSVGVQGCPFGREHKLQDMEVLNEDGVDGKGYLECC